MMPHRACRSWLAHLQFKCLTMVYIYMLVSVYCYAWQYAPSFYSFAHRCCSMQTMQDSYLYSYHNYVTISIASWRCVIVCVVETKVIHTISTCCESSCIDRNPYNTLRYNTGPSSKTLSSTVLFLCSEKQCLINGSSDFTSLIYDRWNYDWASIIRRAHCIKNEFIVRRVMHLIKLSVVDIELYKLPTSSLTWAISFLWTVR